MKLAILPVLICLLLAAETTEMAQKPASSKAARKAAIEAAMMSCGPPSERVAVHLGSGASRSTSTNPAMATIYFTAVSTGRLWPNPTIRIAMDGSWIGALKQNSYTQLEVTPGPHHFCVRIPGIFRLEPASLYGLNTRPGDSYYFVVDDRNSNEFQPIDTISLNRIDSDEGHLLVTQARRATSSPNPEQ